MLLFFIGRTGLCPFKSEVSGALPGKAALVSFGQHAEIRVFHAQFHALAVFQLKGHKVISIGRRMDGVHGGTSVCHHRAAVAGDLHFLGRNPGALWSLWHLPLIFIKGTYQAGLMVNPLYVVNFFVSGIPLGFIITWVYLVSDRSILACMIFHLFVNFMQEKIAMTPETKCVETIVVTVAAAVIVLANKEMFFETRHVGRLLETLQEEKA